MMSPRARRIGLPLLVAAVVAGALLLNRRMIDVELALDFGADAARVRKVELVFTDEHDRVARDLSLDLPTGGAGARHTIRLRQGDYRVGARIDFDGAPERTLTLSLHVADSGSYPIDLKGDLK